MGSLLWSPTSIYVSVILNIVFVNRIRCYLIDSVFCSSSIVSISSLLSTLACLCNYFVQYQSREQCGKLFSTCATPRLTNPARVIDEKSMHTIYFLWYINMMLCGGCTCKAIVM